NVGGAGPGVGSAVSVGAGPRNKHQDRGGIGRGSGERQDRTRGQGKCRPKSFHPDLLANEPAFWGRNSPTIPWSVTRKPVRTQQRLNDASRLLGLMRCRCCCRVAVLLP